VVREGAAFAIKQVRASQFALFIFAVASITRGMSYGRYDLMLGLCLAFQGWMVATRRETLAEFGCIAIFHGLGLALELYKVSHGSWSYPGDAFTKWHGVPIFSGFMYASVASYVFQANRQFDLEFERWPKWPAVLAATGAIYLNFFLNRYFADIRWPIAFLVMAIYFRCQVSFTTLPDVRRRMPMPVAFMAIGFFVWVAEHLCTFLKVWQYPDQAEGWTWVSVGKWSSWTLLKVVSVSIATEWMSRTGSSAMDSRAAGNNKPR
jgi:uncharacterized membrane protein YoaT (DUF817 family)